MKGETRIQSGTYSMHSQYQTSLQHLKRNKIGSDGDETRKNKNLVTMEKALQLNSKLKQLKLHSQSVLLENQTRPQAKGEDPDDSVKSSVTASVRSSRLSNGSRRGNVNYIQANRESLTKFPSPRGSRLTSKRESINKSLRIGTDLKKSNVTTY